MIQSYHETISLIERLHRHFLEVVKVELDRLGMADVNNVQTLILYNIGKEELTVGELTNRGYYLGSNVSYNVKKMVEHGYLEHERSAHDRRSIRVRLSAKGLELYDKMNLMFERHVAALEESPIDEETLRGATKSLKELERFWTNLLTYGIRDHADLGASAA
ncbi:MAG: winged helix-turn-helix transcriptional regulator [Proteobacteria bacterium]|nr:winged helix-turn-helix transcriptional regulator [Pseudomonadota bacterium]